MIVIGFIKRKEDRVGRVGILYISIASVLVLEPYHAKLRR